MGLKEWDLYRRIPRELTEASSHGWFLSIAASICIILLVVAETSSFLAVDVISEVVIDSNPDHTVRIALNISLPRVPCEYAAINVVDVLGTRDFNVSKNVRRFALDANGRQLRRMVDISPLPLDSNIKIDTHHPSLEELHQNGEHAVLIEGTEHFDAWLSDHPLVFVDFYAPWCKWCQKLAPSFEVLAEKAYEEQLDVSIIRVDCDVSKELCLRERIMAFPLLRLYRKGVLDPPDYSLDRTVDSMMTYLKSKVFLTDDELSKEPAATDAKTEFFKRGPGRKRRIRSELSSSTEEEVGCMLQGYLNVNRYFIRSLCLVALLLIALSESS
jgi:thiol-disulfide isomerase/thioredoxin